MPSTVRETTVECEAGDVAEREGVDPRAYPYRRLECGAGTWRPSMRAVELGNLWIRATFALELGGRILELRGGSEEILGASRTLRPTSSWGSGGVEHARDAFLDAGIQLLAPDRTAVRMPSLGPVEAVLSPPQDEAEPASLAMAGLLAGSDLGFHVFAELPPDRCALLMESRFLNRSLLKPAPFWASWRMRIPGARPFLSPDGTVAAAIDPGTGRGVATVFDPNQVRDVRWVDGALEVGRHPGGTLLGPRQTDSLRLTLVPLEAMHGLVAAGPELFAALEGACLRLFSVGASADCRLFVLVRGGETLETSLDLAPGLADEIELPSEPLGFEVRAFGGEVLLRWDSDSPKEESTPTPWTPIPASLAALNAPAVGSCEAAYLAGAEQRSDGKDPSASLSLAAIAPELRALCALQSAMALLLSGEAARASEEAESALGFNAEDPLAWWLKAVADRLALKESPDAPELPNAHFLAPLEPALRAEAFLSQPAGNGGGLNPLLAPLADMPDLALEVACLYLDLGVWDQALRLIDELLRHREQPLLRYLLAYSHLRATGMEVDVAQHLGLAAAQGIQPPFPWRPVELRALRELGGHAPKDARLAEWNALVAMHCPER